MTKSAMNRIRELSADEETRRLAFVRERALRDEVSFLNDAKREGLQEGEQLGIEKGEKQGIEKTARNLLKLGVLNDEQIAEATGLAVDEIAELRIEDKH
jgi:predicted transposase/invertase (TIGR01784 family)